MKWFAPLWNSLVATAFYSKARGYSSGYVNGVKSIIDSAEHEDVDVPVLTSKFDVEGTFIPASIGIGAREYVDGDSIEHAALSVERYFLPSAISPIKSAYMFFVLSISIAMLYYDVLLGIGLFLALSVGVKMFFYILCLTRGFANGYQVINRVTWPYAKQFAMPAVIVGVFVIGLMLGVYQEGLKYTNFWIYDEMLIKVISFPLLFVGMFVGHFIMRRYSVRVILIGLIAFIAILRLALVLLFNYVE